MCKNIKAGVYKITNLITEEFYIGSSSNTSRRWSDHKTRAKQKQSKEYNKKLYVAMREYGYENFKFEVIEEIEDTSKLFDRELYYIITLDAYNKGYNENHQGENHGKAKLTAEDVVEIRDRYKNLERKKDVYIDYCMKINWTGFCKVWQGETWQHICMDVYDEKIKARQLEQSLSHKGSINGRSLIKEEDVVYIRTEKMNGSSLNNTYKNFSDKITLGSFRNIWYGYSWKHITIPVSTKGRES